MKFKSILAILLLTCQIGHGANWLTEYATATPAAGDVFVFQDISDTSSQTYGTTKYVIFSSFAAEIAGSTFNPTWSDGTRATEVWTVDTIGAADFTLTFGQESVQFGGDLNMGTYDITNIGTMGITTLNATSLEFEGATADAFETTLGAIDPTADNTINLPDASGTVALTLTQTALPADGILAADTAYYEYTLAADTWTLPASPAEGQRIEMNVDNAAPAVITFGGAGVQIPHRVGFDGTAATVTLPIGNNQLWFVYANSRWNMTDTGENAGAIETDAWIIAISDETTDLTTGTGKIQFLAPYAATITGVRASVTTAPTDATLIIDINDGGTSIMTTNKLDILTTATTDDATATLTDTAIAQWAVITIDIDQIGSTIAGAGAKIYISHTH